MPEPFDTFRTALIAALESVGVSIEDRHVELYFAHFEAMVRANQTMNLTRITDPQEAAVKHYADSLAILPWIKVHDERVRTVLDVGTGAGFPAIPLAIVKPLWDVVALDGTGKKIAFVQEVCDSLHIKNVAPIHAHSKHYESDKPFDLVLARAVGSLSKCLTASAAHVKPKGLIVIYKTPGAGEELAEAESTAVELRLELLPPHAYRLPLGHEVLERRIIAYRKGG